MNIYINAYGKKVRVTDPKKIKQWDVVADDTRSRVIRIAKNV